MGGKDTERKEKCLVASDPSDADDAHIMAPIIHEIRKLSDTGVRLQNPAKGAAYMKEGEVYTLPPFSCG
jgi:hypothetical protein